MLLHCVQKMAASLTLDIGEDRILLETRSNVYRLDIYLPFLLIQADCVAQFNRRTKVSFLEIISQFAYIFLVSFSTDYAMCIECTFILLIVSFCCRNLLCSC